MRFSSLAVLNCLGLTVWWVKAGAFSPIPQALSRPITNVGVLCARTPQGYSEDEYDKPPLETRTFRESPEARELRDMRYQEEEDEDDALDEEYIIDEYEDPVVEEEYFDEGEEYVGDEGTEEDLPVGNFWSNPRMEMDKKPTEPQAYPRRRGPVPPTTAPPHRRRGQRPSRRISSDSDEKIARRRTTFRSGTPPPPAAVKDFYDRLFWYGFDPDVRDPSPAGTDKTMFGGTKGKFNALSYFSDMEGQKRGKPIPANDYYYDDEEEDDEYYEDGEFEEDYEDEESETLGPVARSRPARPRREDEDNDVAPVMRPRLSVRRRQPIDFVGDGDRQSPRRRRQPQRSDDWVGDEVSSWFRDDKDLAKNSVQRRRRERRKDNPITQFIDEVFQVDRDEMKMNAEVYQRQTSQQGSTRDRRSGERRRRPGYTYKYEKMEYNVRPGEDLGEAEIVEEQEDVTDEELSGAAAGVVDVEVTEETGEEDLPKQKRSLEERALAFERIPPVGIPAWGPSGDLGIDARTKAVLDAVEELREAERILELKKERVAEAREDIVILRADEALARKRATRGDPRAVRAQLREISLQIEDANRTLRRAKNDEERARVNFEAVEDRHWALLSLYDAEKAFTEVTDTLEQFEREEPAVRAAMNVGEGDKSSEDSIDETDAASEDASEADRELEASDTETDNEVEVEES